MMLLPTLLGILAAGILVFAGYLLGVKRGFRERDQLRKQAALQIKEHLRLRELVSHITKDDSDTLNMRRDLLNMTKALVSHSKAVNRILEPLNKRDSEFDSLKTIVEQALAPLKQRDQLAYELSSLNAKFGDRNNLVLLLDQIADKGQFWAVSLHDEQGLLLAASRNAKNIDRLTAISTMVLLFADRIGRNEGPAPLSLLVHDESNMATLVRIFQVGEQRLLLSAVATGAQLTATALDPALSKVSAVLSSPA